MKKERKIPAFGIDYKLVSRIHSNKTIEENEQRKRERKKNCYIFSDESEQE